MKKRRNKNERSLMRENRVQSYNIELKQRQLSKKERMRVTSNNSYFPLIEARALRSVNQGHSFDENTGVRNKTAYIMPCGDSLQQQSSQQQLTQPLKQRQNTIDVKKKFSILQPGSIQKDLIKTLSDKLDNHQHQIDSRNGVIEELERQVQIVKTDLFNERNALALKTDQNNKLTDQIDKLSLRLRTSTNKFEELQSKSQTTEQELKNARELEKTRTDQFNQSQRKIAELEAKLNNALSDNKTKSKNDKNEQAKQLADLQSQISKMEGQLEKVRHELKISDEKAKLLEKEKLEYCSETLELRQRCAQYKEKADSQSNANIEIDQLKKLLAESQRNQSQLQEANEKKALISRDNIKKLEQENERLRKEEKDRLEELERIKREDKSELEKLKREDRSEMERQRKEDKAEMERTLYDEREKLQHFEKLRKQDREEINTLKEYVERKESQITQLHDEVNKLRKDYDHMKGQNFEANFHLTSAKNKEQQLKIHLDKLEKGETELLKSLKCSFCSKFIKEPVTVIPCGHSFCLGCKKAYAKECIKCGPKIKVEAMYRNELLDDIIALYKTINSIKESISTITKSK